MPRATAVATDVKRDAPKPRRLRQRRESAAAPGSKEASAVASVEETSFTLEFKRGLKRAKKTDSSISNKENTVRGKVPEAKQGPVQVESTHCAPSIVARLMGLDTMPRANKVLGRCKSDIQANRQRQLSGGVEEAARASSGYHQPCNVCANELPALKDVFEVSEMERSGDKQPHLRSSEVDLEFVRQKFMHVKSLCMDESYRNSEEFNEALEVLHSQKDVFLEILQENRAAVSGFSGNILNTDGLQSSPHTSAAAADNVHSFDQEILWGMELGREEVFDAVTDSEELTPNTVLKERSVTPLESLEQEECKGSGHRSHIVVLKPNLRRKSFAPVLSSQEASQGNRRKGKQHVKSPKQAIMHSAPNNEVSEQGGIMIQRASERTPRSVGRRSPEEYKLSVDSERKKITCPYDSIPICSSTGSSVSRKTRRHLSERWQTACQSSSENSLPGEIKTLGEMLELSARGAAKETSSHKRSSGPDRVVPASPLGISSKDGWKTGIYCEDHSRGGITRNFSRSKSLPASSTSSSKLSSRRQSASACRLPILKDVLNTPTDESEIAHVKKRSSMRNAMHKNGKSVVQLGKENMLVPEKEIHVTSEKERHSICISDLPLAANTYPDDSIMSRNEQAYEFAVQHEQKNSKCHMDCSDIELATSSPETQDQLICYQDIIELTEGRNPSMEIDVTEDDQAVKSLDIASAENCECSSSTASSQLSSSEDMSYSGIFNTINVGIQGLREQLKMLKMEDQNSTCGYYSDTFSSDECSSPNSSSYQVMEGQVPVFKDEEDRDFSYVQDMLASVRDFSAYPEDWQVSSHVFLGLENKYSKLLLWSKSDRKLLFDLVNSLFADMTAPSSSSRSKFMAKYLSEMERGQFAKYVWQMVQKQRCYEQVAWDCILPLSLDHHSELELIKLEIFKMIHDDIIEGFIIEFMSKMN